MYYQNQSYRSGGNFTRRKKRKPGKVVKTVVIVLLILALLPLATIGIGKLAGSDEKTRYKSDILEISADATAGNCGSDINYAEALSLDKKVFTVNFGSGTATSSAYISKAASGAEIRLYSAGGEDKNGNSITVESEKNIVYIEIEFSSSSGAYSINGKEFTSADTRHIINSTSFTIKNIDTTGSSKVLIKNIYIVYED